MKTTIILSEIDTLIADLSKTDAKSKQDFINLRGKPKLAIIGEVDLYINGILRSRELRQLEYGEKVILEQVVRDPDNDNTDYLHSRIFNRNKLPSSWTLEVYEEEKDDVSFEVEVWNSENQDIIPEIEKFYGTEIAVS
jgi:hypothetical protein